MDIDGEREAILAEKQRLGWRGRGREYPAAFAARVRAYGQLLGLSRQRLARELGIGDNTLAKWLAKPRASAPKLVRVQLAAEPPASSAAFVVHGPAGLRVEGMDVESLALLLRRLA